jgi:hypothetical protein
MTARCVCISLSLARGVYLCAQKVSISKGGEEERERKREKFLLTITKSLKVGKHNALSGDTGPGSTGSSIDGE